MLELEDLFVGMVCITPSGRRAIVKRVLTGQSKKDLCERVILRFEGGPPNDLVTLQPHQLKRAPMPIVVRAPSMWQQMALL